jgi:uracil-DNA glycosylase family 4
MQTQLNKIHKSIVTCNECPRLRKYCQEIAEVKRRAFISETYWGKPIPGFGEPNAQLMIVGLAPAAHGANRTGRIFTGDRSGDWLYRALHKAGFANQPNSTDLKDGLSLQNAYVSCVVRCAPPDNKPNPSELKNCSSFLKQEIEIFNHARVWIALGQIAYQALWQILQPKTRRPAFSHGGEIQLNENQWLLLSYHPSQQNTFTGRLTEPMFDSVFSKAKNLIYANHSISKS